MPEDPRVAEAVRLINDAEELVRDERPRAALERAEAALRASEGLPDAVRAAAFHARGRAYDELGDADAAVADLTTARDLEPGSPERWVFLAQLAASHEDFDVAAELFAQAIDVAEASGERSVIPQSHWERAQLELLRGDADAARRELGAAVATAEELGDVEGVAFAELALADLETELGDAERAQERYAHVRALAALLPDRGPARVSAEPAAPAPVDEPDPAERLAPPTDREPVVRVVLAPRLGEHAEIELWTNDGAAPTRCVVPFRFAVHPRTEERLRWYAEEYASRPIDPAPAIAAEVETELEQLGEALFDALFAHPESASIADRVRADIGRVRVELVADALTADTLPWELLRDPVTGANVALAARAMTRTTSAASAAYGAVRDDGEVRILLVIARPAGRLDVGFRSVADPLVRELSGASVSIDVLRPPTFEQLVAVVATAKAAGRPYDLMHFDGHGVFDAASGRSALVFESGDEPGTRVEGDELGEALRAGDVPLLVMNACRSAGGQHGQAYGSVARQALERGLAGVVAMRFNVYVPTAALFVSALYGALGAGRELQDAVTGARRQLAERPDRAGLHVVRDWCVPALYQAAPVRLASVGTAVPSARAREVGLPPPPAHGFVGRDEVFVELETALVGSPHVVLRAVAGAGKTAAATEFARWYAGTGGCGVAGPLVSLAGAPTADLLRGPLTDRPLLLWDDVRALTGEHRALLGEIAAAGGRVIVIADRPVDLPGVPLVTLSNLPPEEGLALALAVGADAGAALTPELAEHLAKRLRGHALAIELAVRELARRGETDVESLIAELADPTNGDPEPWTRPLGEQVELTDSRAEPLVAQFRGYVTVPGFAMLRDGGHDMDAAEAELMELRARGITTRIGDAEFAIHPGLAVALAAAGRYDVPGRAFTEAMAETATAWTGIAEVYGMPAPWATEAANLLAARRIASRERWWPLVVQLLDGVSALAVHAGRPEVWHAELNDAAGDFVDPETGDARPGMEDMASVFLGHLASLAEIEGDRAKEVRMRALDVRHRRAAAADALATPPERRSEQEYALVRRLVVGLTNLGHAQSEVRDTEAVATMREAIALARDLGEWRLQALNHLNLGTYWMTVPWPFEFDRADEEFAAGYDLSIQDDPPLAGTFMTERGTVHYERGQASADRDTAQAHYERAAELLDLAVGLREPDVVLFHQLGQVHRHLGNFADARAWFEETIALCDADPIPGSGADARLHLAQTLQEAGLYDEALSFARSGEQVLAQARDPNPALARDLVQLLAQLELLMRAS